MLLTHKLLFLHSFRIGAFDIVKVKIVTHGMHFGIRRKKHATK